MNRSLTLWRSAELGLVSEPGEDEGAFRVRLTDQARQKRDKHAAELRQKYSRRVARLEDRIRRATQKLDKEKEQVGSQRVKTAISLGATVLSAFLGSKSISRSSLGRATTTARSFERASKEKADVARAEQDIVALQTQLQDLNRELEGELDDLEDRFDALADELEETAERPRRSDVRVDTVTLAWAPYDGDSRPLWR
jgi:TolA-binding protein